MSRVKTFPSLPDCVTEMGLWKATRTIPTLQQKMAPCPSCICTSWNLKATRHIMSWIIILPEWQCFPLATSEAPSSSKEFGNAAVWPCQSPTKQLEGCCHTIYASQYIDFFIPAPPEQPLLPALSLRCCCRFFPSRFQWIMSPKATQGCCLHSSAVRSNMP